MSRATALEPVVTIGTAYQLAEKLHAIPQRQTAFQPNCSQSGTTITVTPPVAPSP